MSQQNRCRGKNKAWTAVCPCPDLDYYHLYLKQQGVYITKGNIEVWNIHINCTHSFKVKKNKDGNLYIFKTGFHSVGYKWVIWFI